MKTNLIFISILFCFTANFSSAQPDVTLHVNPKWDECSFQLDPSLTQKEWHQFTQEASLIVYFRPLADAKPMGVGHFELSVLKWNTGIDETDGAWNNTFVHPDATHWLIGGEQLPFPGLTLRTGVTKKMDAGAYWTMRPGANYGVFGGQVQYNFINDSIKNWALASRIGFNNLYGPDDLNLTVYGLDLLASKSYKLFSELSLSLYTGVSTYLSHAREKTDAVDLNDENIAGAQGMIGTVIRIFILQLGVEYNVAKVNTFSYKVGVDINFKSKNK